MDYETADHPLFCFIPFFMKLIQPQIGQGFAQYIEFFNESKSWCYRLRFGRKSGTKNLFLTSFKLFTKIFLKTWYFICSVKKQINRKLNTPLGYQLIDSASELSCEIFIPLSSLLRTSLVSTTRAIPS